MELYWLPGGSNPLKTNKQHWQKLKATSLDEAKKEVDAMNHKSGKGSRGPSTTYYHSIATFGDGIFINELHAIKAGGIWTRYCSIKNPKGM